MSIPKVWYTIHMKSTLDKRFSDYIRAKAKWRCERCRKKVEGRDAQCAHISSRRYLTTRWREENALCLCAKCHRFFHDHPQEFGIWLDDVFPGRRQIIQEILNTEIVKPRDFPQVREHLSTLQSMVE